MNRDSQTYHPESTEGQIKLGVQSMVMLLDLVQISKACRLGNIVVAKIDIRVNVELAIQLGTV